MEDSITVVFTSCGRFNLLETTFNSFLKMNTYPINRIVIIENSGLPESHNNLCKIIKNNNVDLIINEKNIGQVSSIDKVYETIDTDYIFHCEDDWEFIKGGFIEKSLDVLKTDNNIVNVNIRVRFDGEKGSMHPLEPTKYLTNNNTFYYKYVTNYLGEWHGFSWNPGLRRLNDYLIIKPFIKYKNEQGVGKQYNLLGYKSACLEEFYCKHIGNNSVTLNSNM